MEDLTKLSISDLISTLNYLEDIEYGIKDFLELAEKAREENDSITELQIKTFNDYQPRFDVDEEDFYSPDKIKEMRSNLEIITSKISGFKKEIDKKLQLPITYYQEIMNEAKDWLKLTDKTREAYNELKRRGEITKEMKNNFMTTSLPYRTSYNYNDEELKEKFLIWSTVVRYLIEEEGEFLTPKNYRSIQRYLKDIVFS